jgi:hypothetical protein
MHGEETVHLEQRVAMLEKKYDLLAGEISDRIKGAAHDLREDDSFMRPAAERFTDHASEHLLTKAGRRVFLWLVAFVGGAALLWAGSTKFWAH